MATYVVHAQVVGARPRRADRAPARPARPAMTAPPASIESEVAIDIVGRGIGAVVRERWGRAAEIWSQTTFYLFDPNSWR